MVTSLGEYRLIKIFHDSDFGETKIVFGDAKKRKKGNELIKPIDLYKESVKEEPKIPQNKMFRPMEVNDFEKCIKVTWIIGGPKDVEVYKEAIDLIYEKFNVRNTF